MPRTSSRTSSASAADTIVALATPPGGGLRAIVRLSGPRAVELAGGLPGAITFRAPRSFTREDVVEVPLPASPPLVERRIRELCARGARPAKPGEFTLRAFLHGRLDLAQAEAVEQLISAESEEERRAALSQLDGDFSARLRSLEGALLDLCADAEAAIDFVDQDIEILPVASAVERGAGILAELRALQAESAARRVSDERPVVVLYGRPNAGKSALFNRLGGAAIVSPLAGTTRDALEADLGGARLFDLPGDFEASGADGEAARRARERAARADLTLFVVDATDPEPSRAIEPRDRAALLVLNKCDLGGAAPRFGLREVVRTSAATGEGVEELRARISAMLKEDAGGGRFRVSLRQRALLREAEAALDRAGGAAGLGMEFVALDLRAALDALGAISGRQVGEDLLDRIFSRFCLGK